jgi:3-phenylpropionate/cinnamic acid dioxygenase small subunit
VTHTVTSSYVKASDPLYADCLEWLNLEAELLDARRFREWLDMLSQDIDYRVPVRTGRNDPDHSVSFSTTAFHMLETWHALEERVRRFESGYAWSEIPPSRTRRFVSNVRVLQPGMSHEAQVKSNLLVYRVRGDLPPELLCGERQDVLVREHDRWRLLRRLVLLDQTSLPTQNLGVFL